MQTNMISAAEMKAFARNARNVTGDERTAILQRITYRNAVEARAEPAHAAELAQRLAKQVRGKGVARAKIAADVSAILVNAIRAKRCIAFGECPARFFDTVAEILAAYNTEVVRTSDPLGMAVGCIFAGSKYRNGAGNVFYLA